MGKSVVFKIRLTTEEKKALQMYADVMNCDYDSVLHDMRQKKKEEMLKKHPYQIFYAEKEQRWKTNLPDETKKTGRRIIARKEREELETIVAQYYLDKEDAAYLKEHIYEGYTLRDIYPLWLAYKEMKTDAKSYIKRIDNDFKRFYASDAIIDTPVQDLDFNQLEEWAHKKVKEYHLTKTSYYNMSTIIRNCLNYAMNVLHIIDKNPFDKVKIQSKLFMQPEDHENYTQVFPGGEAKAVCAYAFKKYIDNPNSTTPLAIIFNFHLGLRIGELTALKWSDIKGDKIKIQRMQTERYDIVDGKVCRLGWATVPYTKTLDGMRELYLNSEAREILKLVKETNEKRGLYEDNYIFLTGCEKKSVDGTTIRLVVGAYNDYLYNLCEDLKIYKKSSHKVRKHYLSSLMKTDLDIDKIRAIGGQRRIETLLKSYIHDTNTDEYTKNILETVNYGIL